MRIPGIKPVAPAAKSGDDVLGRPSTIIEPAFADPGRPSTIGEPDVDELSFPDQFELEADAHERAGRHAEAGVLRDVARRLRGDKDDGGDPEAG